jgi:hypothetical protein
VSARTWGFDSPARTPLTSYRSAHGRYVRGRARWFEPVRQPSTVLWWIEASKRPTVDEALRRLRYLQAHGPSPGAFTPRRRFEPDGRLPADAVTAASASLTQLTGSVSDLTA